MENKGKNSHVEEYLKFFLDITPSPGYAVHIDGEWGAGKTWFIKKFQESNEKYKYLYVSLYGVKSISQIEDQFFQQLHPWLASKAFNIGAKLLKGVVKTSVGLDLNGDNVNDVEFSSPTIPTEDIQKMLSDAENRVLIFDDLERCPIAEDVLGYINHFVEHQGKRVILIGHQEELEKKTEFLKIKEKLVGRSFKFSTEVEAAFESFVDLLSDNKTREVLRENSETILDIYDISETKNLRTLKYSVSEYGRFFSYLPQKAQEHKDFQSDCIRSFFVLCIEMRMGRLRPNEIENLMVRIRKESSFERLSHYFDSVSKPITPNGLSMYNFFEFGFVPSEVITEAVDSNQYFIVDNTPMWTRLWYVLNLKDSDFELISSQVFSDFENLKYSNEGEIKHIVGMMLSYSKRGLISIAYEKALEKCHAVVDLLISQKKIDILNEKSKRYAFFGDVYAGLQFTFHDEKDFRDISEKIERYQNARHEETLVDLANGLPELIKTKREEVIRILSSSESPYASSISKPFLKYVSPSLFAAALVEMDPSYTGRFSIGHALKERYSYLSVYQDLKEELDWMKRLKEEISLMLPTLKQPTRFHLESLNEQFIDPSIKRIEDFKPNEYIRHS